MVVRLNSHFSIQTHPYLNNLCPAFLSLSRSLSCCCYNKDSKVYKVGQPTFPEKMKGKQVEPVNTRLPGSPLFLSFPIRSISFSCCRCATEEKVFSKWITPASHLTAGFSQLAQSTKKNMVGKRRGHSVYIMSIMCFLTLHALLLHYCCWCYRTD